HRDDGRAHAIHLDAALDRSRADPQRSAARARGEHRAAICRASRRSNDRRGRIPARRVQLLGRHARSGEHAARNPRAPERRGAARTAWRRHEGAPRGARFRADGDDARAVRRIHQGGIQRAGRSHARFGRQGAMKFGVFYEHQLPRPWADGAEEKLLHEALDQVQLADELGIDFAWEVEHHFLEEYSHSSAPEVFLAACSQRTKRIRLGHGIMLMLPGYNHPARAAERIATLDLVSRGRVEWGTGMSASRTEIEGFGIDPAQRQAMWQESVEQATNMLVMDPYPGFEGKFFSMPVRNVVPKPAQKPHPPLWLACSNRNTIRIAAKNGMGALTFAFIDPAEAREWVEEYYEIFKRECVPIGHAVNPNIAMVTGFSCHADVEEARRRGNDGFRFFQFALGHYYAFGRHAPGRTDIWTEDEAGRDERGTEVLGGGTGCIGSPADLRAALRTFADAGVD